MFINALQTFSEFLDVILKFENSFKDIIQLLYNQAHPVLSSDFVAQNF
jgi:hypothetical protein